ncbi:MAG: ABC transporter permease [Bacillota bacterium]
MSKKIMKVIYYILPVLSVMLLLIGWIYISTKKPELFPSPLETGQRFLKFIERPLGRIPLWKHVLDSLRRVGIAVTLACTVGILFGLAIGWNRVIKSTFGTLFEVARPIPPIAWIPLITIWFGIGELSKILIVYIGTFSVVVVNTYTGVLMVDPINLSVGKIFHAGKFRTFYEIVLPASLPAIFAGIRMAVGTGWAIILAAEMLGAKSGAGFLISRGNEIGDTPLIFICMFIIGIIGALLSLLASYVERRVCPWKEEKKS